MDRVLDRRGFLQSSTVAGAGLLLTPGLYAAEQAGRADDIHVALIGVGAQGDVLMNTCLKLGENAGIRFQAVCDIYERLTLRRVARVLQKYGHEAHPYVDYQELLAQEKDLDAAIIATPDFCHAEQTAACLQAGLHVYCEAPMSNKPEGARAMVQTAQKTGKHLQIGFQRRSNPRYLHCWENLIQSARILGRITAANAQWNRGARADRGWSRRREVPEDRLTHYGYDSMQQFRNWMWYRELGSGPLGCFGSHQIDVLNWFLGTGPRTVTAQGGTHYYDPKTHQCYDTVMAVLEYETRQGTVSALYQTINSNGYGKHHEVLMGDQGSMELSESEVGLYRDPEASDWEKWVRLGFIRQPGEPKPTPEATGVLSVQPRSQPPVTYQVPVVMEDPYTMPHLINFFAAIRGQADLNCPPDRAYAATVIVQKINQAVAAHQCLTIDPEELTV